MGIFHAMPHAQSLRDVLCVQYLCKKPSLSGLDRQIFGIFFLWGFVSVLIGGIVGGSVLTAFSPSIVSQPSELSTACSGVNAHMLGSFVLHSQSASVLYAFRPCQ